MPTAVLRRSADEPWRAPIGFILPKDGRFTQTSRPTVLATTGLAIVLRPSDTRVPAWGGEVLIRVDVIAPAADGTARWGENVAIVLDGDGPDAATLVDAALGQLAGRDRVTIIDAQGARVIVPMMPASHRSMAMAALKNHMRTRARGARHASGPQGGRRRDRLTRGHAARPRPHRSADGSSRCSRDVASHAAWHPGRHRAHAWGRRSRRTSEAVRTQIPQAGLTKFRSVRLTFEGTPAPSHVLEASGGETRWALDAGDLVLGNVRAGEARTEVLRVTVPPWVPNEQFKFTVSAHVDDLDWGGPRDFAAEVPCIYDDDIERIAKSRHGDVIAYASAMATLRRLDAAFIGATRSAAPEGSAASPSSTRTR